jgi:simple sugar transport system substrate-binding protein
MIIFNSDDFKDDALETAKKYPNMPVIHASGDYSWKDGASFKNQPNLANIMGQMEYGKMIGGCAAALGTETGKIAYIGPLINEETRRLVSSAYLGARYCFEKYRGKKASELSFRVNWIGFWFNIPGVTLDPTKVMNEFINGGYDVTISGLDTPEAAQETKKAAAAGKKVKFVHYDLKTGCDIAADQCLGSPYFNWGPEYVKAIKAAQDGKFNNYPFVWAAPDWKDINNVDSSMIGYTKGKALGDNAAKLDEFIKGLADGSVNPWKGPIKFQDGTDFVKDGATATPKQIWYMEQLVQGIDGKSK